MAKQYQGRCHCGQVEWEVSLTEDQTGHVLCHCSACKIVSGGAFTLNQIIPKSAFKFTKNGDTVKTYTYQGDSGNPIHCYYCGNCTAHAYHHQTALGPDTIILRTALLKEMDAFPPAAEIYGRDRLGWQKEVAKTFTLGPE